MGYHDTVILYDVTDPYHPVQQNAFPHPAAVPRQPAMSIAFSPDGRTLATSSHSADLALWSIADPSRPTVVATLPVGPLEGKETTFSPDGDTLAVLHQDGRVQLWNVADQPRPTVSATFDAAAVKGGFTGGVAAGTTVAFTADGRTLVTVIGSEKATTWDISQPGRTVRLRDVTRTAAGPARRSAGTGTRRSTARRRAGQPPPTAEPTTRPCRRTIRVR